MKKFDMIYEQALRQINEKSYVDSTFEDNISLLIKLLKDNDYVSSDKDTTQLTKELLDQEDNVKELVLDLSEDTMPPVKLHLSQESDSENFKVEVIDVNNPEKPKIFKNNFAETIFEDVIDYIKQLILQGLAPENAVDQMPQEEGPNAQPGGGESALPTGEEPAPEEQQPPA